MAYAHGCRRTVPASCFWEAVRSGTRLLIRRLRDYNR